MHALLQGIQLGEFNNGADVWAKIYKFQIVMWSIIFSHTNNLFTLDIIAELNSQFFNSLDILDQQFFYIF